MINGKDNKIYSKSRIIKGKKQTLVTIPNKDWGYFEVDDRVMIMNTKQKFITSNVREVSNGKQRVISIHINESNIFNNKEIVKIFNLTRDHND